MAVSRKSHGRQQQRGSDAALLDVRCVRRLQREDLVVQPLDLAATWNVNKILQLRAGANNVLDKDPPVINTFAASNGSANTYSAYDIFGRQLFVAFTAKF